MRQPAPRFTPSARDDALPTLTAWGVGAGLVLGLAQPGWGLPWLGAVSAVPFWLALARRSWWARLAVGWIAGSVSAAVAVGDAAAVGLRSYFELGAVEGAAAWLLADQLLGALPLGVVAVVVGDLARAPAGRGAALAGGAWILGEAIRGVIFPGPWLSLAASLTPEPFALQAVSWIGSLGMAGLIAALSQLVARALSGRPRRAELRVVLALVGVVLAPSALGGPGDVARLTRVTSSEREPLEPRRLDAPARGAGEGILLVQSGVDARQAESVHLTDATRIARLLALTREPGPVALAIWPEGALRSPWPQNVEALAAHLGDAADAGALILGVPWIEPRSQPPIQSVAAVLLASEGGLLARHLKTRLVPIAEGPAPISWLERVASPGRFVPAERPMLLEAAGLRIGASICYEVLFSDLARHQVGQGAEILVNLSNESWLGSRTRGPDQMLAAAVLRAIETGRPVLRATTTGLSAAIDGRGRMQARLPRGGSGWLLVDVTAAGRSSSTVFSRLGDGPVILMATLLTLWGRLSGSRRRGPTAPHMLGAIASDALEGDARSGSRDALGSREIE